MTFNRTDVIVSHEMVTGWGGAVGIKNKTLVDVYSATGNTNNTKFQKIMKNGSTYNQSSSSTEYQIPKSTSSRVDF